MITYSFTAQGVKKNFFGGGVGGGRDTSPKKLCFDKAGLITMFINFKYALKLPCVQEYMPPSFHRKFHSSSSHRFGDRHDTSPKKLFFGKSGPITL